MLTAAFLGIALFRILGSLPVLRWPFAGGLLAVLVDLGDLLLLDWLDPAGFAHYQAFDKWVDQVYLALFLVVALRWHGVERTVAVALYLFRLVGFVAFELSGERLVLVVFPNVFELWFLVVAATHARGWRPAWRPAQVVAVLLVATVVKELQEWALHGARLFDQLTALGVLEEIGRAVTGLLTAD